MVDSPYTMIARDAWPSQTMELVNRHPLRDDIVDVVMSCWASIFDSKLGTRGFRIGVDIQPKPQIMGFFLHELIALEVSSRYPGVWRGELNASDKDLVYIPDNIYSVEIKTSSDKAHIYGNRSYAQETASDKKGKTGYYLAINFEKFVQGMRQPKINLIRFGWLDHSDWMGQKAASGQQARLDGYVEKSKLLVLFPQ